MSIHHWKVPEPHALVILSGALNRTITLIEVWRPAKDLRFRPVPGD